MTGRPGAERTPVQRMAFLLASLGGTGRFPIAPATVGSAITVGLYAVAMPSNALFQLGVLSALLPIAIWASSVSARHDGDDPSYVIIDEVIGMLVACFVLPKTAQHLAAAFFLFRLLDIGKWFPMKQLERLPGGWGIVADDLAAGLLTRCALWLLAPWL